MLIIFKKKNDEKLLNFINIIKKKKSLFFDDIKVPPRQLPTKINDLLSRVLIH